MRRITSSKDSLREQLRHSRHLIDDIHGLELGDSSLYARLPAKYIDLDRVSEFARQLIRNYFKERVRGEVFVVVDVRFDHDAIHTVDGGDVIFMKRELDVG